MIEGVEFEVEGGHGEEPPYEVKAFLTLEGDFAEECEAYLSRGTINSMVFELPRGLAEKLCKQLSEVLYG